MLYCKKFDYSNILHEIPPPMQLFCRTFGFFGQMHTQKGQVVFLDNQLQADVVHRLEFQNKFLIEKKDCGIRLTIHEPFRDMHMLEEFTEGKAVPDTMDFCCRKCSNAAVKQVLEQIRRSIDTGILAEKYFECKILELLFLLSRCEDHPSAKNPKKTLSADDLRAVQRVKEIIDARIRDCPLISELARLTNTSKSKLQYDFKMVFGQTIHEYAQSSRMERARDMIAKTDTPLYLIAQEVGCKKSGRFSEIFKKAYGMTPSEYRRSLHG